jgi:hypothetical protein
LLLGLAWAKQAVLGPKLMLGSIIIQCFLPPILKNTGKLKRRTRRFLVNLEVTYVEQMLAT